MDYSSALSIDFSLIYPELALLLAASVILVTAFLRNVAKMAPTIAFIGLAIGLAAVVEQWGNQNSGFAGMVTCDKLRSL